MESAILPWMTWNVTKRQHFFALPWFLEQYLAYSGIKNAGRKHPARNCLLPDGLKAFCGGRWFSDNRCLRIEKNRLCCKFALLA